jgi:repressor LexA
MAMAKPLPPGQARVLQAIAGLVRRGLSPTAHDLTRALGIRPQSLRQHLEALERKGLLRLHPTGHGRPTHLELTPAGKLLLGLSIPLVGSIPAGPLEASSEELAGLIALPGRPGLYALVVEGDSMAEYLLEGDVVVVEKGPRPRPGEIAALLHEGKTTLKYVFVLTNSVPVALELQGSGHEVLVLGGNMRHHSLALIGPATVRTLSWYRADKAFLGATGVDARGYSTPNPLEAETKRAMLEAAGKAYVLADSGKLGQPTLARFAALQEAVLITDAEADPRAIAALRQAGAEVWVADLALTDSEHPRVGTAYRAEKGGET